VIEMAQDARMPKSSNAAAWAGVGALVYILAVGAATALLHQDAVGAILRSRQVAAMLGLGLILSMTVVGLTSRRRPLSLRALRNYLVQNGVAVIASLLLVWGFTALARAGVLGAMGISEWVAVVTGSVLIVFAALGTLATASAHTRADLIGDDGAVEEMRERGRLFLCSFAWIAACGVLLTGLGLAGPGGALSPAAGLAGALVLTAVLVALGIAAWRLSDELGRTLSREAGNIALYLILALGGGWATLARLGFVAGPAPLDWLTLFTVLMFAASFIAAGRRKLLTR